MPPPTCPAPRAAALVVAAGLVSLLAAAAAIPMMSERVHCHVCGGEDRDHRALFAGQPPPPQCQPEPDLGLPRECPADYKGCLTKFDGTTLTRTCAERAYEPCGVANGVVYCYCSGRLCNAQTEAEMRQLRCAALKRRRAPEDDEDAAVEDASAGSGDGDLPDLTDDCDVTSRQPPAVTTARSDPASTATVSSTTTTLAPGDDLEWGSSSQDSIEITLEANTTTNATGKASGSGSGSGDARRTHGSVVCVLGALFVALRVWRVDAAH
ncbi:uncharacterized protein LOC117652256 isoform X2 [Thrips palmi]|uniref:Uncharacterized protein LOC117652256 isoform X2 n=1 Tax=Thrips palmi TaxID=161013 RepID=A0A6P9A5W7_THRPL|nr:uncharacterized protein LOC117652256 isoform X2 [Thrips palmi]